MAELGVLTAFLAIRAAMAHWVRSKEAWDIGTDEMFHVNLIRQLRANGRRPVATLAGYGNMTELAYPWGFHWLMAHLPESALPTASRYLGSLFDTGLVALALLLAKMLGASPAAIGWTLAIFGTSPFLVRQATGKLSIRERPLGVSLVTAVSVLLAAHQASPSMGLWMLACGVGAIVVFCSKFGVQALVGLGLGSGAMLGSSTIAAVPLVALLLAVLVPGGWGRRLLTAQYLHLRLYWTDIYGGFSTVRDRYSLANLARPARWKTRWRRFSKLVRKQPVLVLVSGLPLLVLFPGAAVDAWQGGEPAPRFLVTWCLAAAGLFVLTSVGKLRIFGQAERYLDFAFVAYAALLAQALAAEPRTLAVVLCGAGALMTVWELVYRRADRSSQADRSAAIRETFEWIAENFPAERILTAPLNWANYGVGLAAGEFCDAMGVMFRGDQAHWRRLVDAYPWPRTNLRELAKTENFSLFVARRHDHLESYDLSGFVEVYRNDLAVVYLRGET